MERIRELYLANYKDFVKIDNKYYGGNQKWFHTEKLRKKFWADRSCGVVAASNSLIYLSIYNEKYRGIYKYPNLSKLNYIRFANELYFYIKPRIYGVHTLNKLSRGVTLFSRKTGFNINNERMSNPKDINKTIKFIETGLRNNSPVLMLTWNTNIKNLKYHWVTITGFYKTATGKNHIITSNWGKKEIFSLDDWIKDRSCYRGLIYFY